MSFGGGFHAHKELFFGFWNALDRGCSLDEAVQAALDNLEYDHANPPDYYDVINIVHGKTAKARRYLWDLLPQRVSPPPSTNVKLADPDPQIDPEILRKAAAYDELKTLGLLEQMGIDE